MGGDVHTVTTAITIDTDTVTATVTTAAITATRAAYCRNISGDSGGGAWWKNPFFILERSSESLSRWHGITGGATVGGDVGAVATIDTVTTATTANHAADRCGVSSDSASGI